MSTCAARFQKSVLAIAILSASSSLFALEAGEPITMEAGSGYFYPSVGIQVSYDDNVLLADTNEIESFVTIITPKARWEADGEASQVGLSLELENGTYASSHSDDYTDYRLLAETAYFPTERSTFYASAKFNHEHEARGSSNSSGGTVPDEYDEWELNGKFQYGLDEVGAPRADISYTHSDREYTNNRTSTVADDRKTDTLKATLFYKVAPSTSLLLEATATQLDYNTGTTDSDQLRLLAGVTWEATAQTTGFVKIGQEEKDFDTNTGSNTDTTDASWEVGVTWQPLSYSTVNLSTDRSYAESSGTGSHNESTTSTLAWTHSWVDQLDTTISYNLVNDDYVNSTREDDTSTIEFKADYRYNYWLVFGAGYKYVERDSNTAGNGYDDNVITFTAGINM